MDVALSVAKGTSGEAIDRNARATIGCGNCAAQPGAPVGPVAQWQSTGLITPGSRVRILSGPPDESDARPSLKLIRRDAAPVPEALLLD